MLLEILFAVGACRAPEASHEAMQPLLDGRNLTAEQAAELETRIKETPTDLEARSRLLGYYFRSAYSSTNARKTRQGHVLWIIERAPESPVAGTPFAQLDAHLDGEVYYKARELWLAAAKQRADDPTILRNAASFLLLHDRDSAKKLLLAGGRLEPECAYWPQQLGHLVSLSRSKQGAAEALSYHERALALMDPDERRAWTSYAAKSAFAAEEFEKAESFAKELVAEPPDRKSWDHGNAIHHGNLILGRLALRSGELDKAKQHLLAAGRTPGSAVLSSFGPNMTLALELIEKGERQAVLEYFELCARFWKHDRGQLKAWAATVKGGGTPDFGANLNY